MSAQNASKSFNLPLVSPKFVMAKVSETHTDCSTYPGVNALHDAMSSRPQYCSLAVSKESHSHPEQLLFTK